MLSPQVRPGQLEPQRVRAPQLEGQLIPLHNNAIDQAVKDKTSTPEQAAQIKARTSEIVKATLQREGGSAAGFSGNRGSGPGNGWHFNRGGRMGPRWNR